MYTQLPEQEDFRRSTEKLGLDMRMVRIELTA